jgi:SAM-dependent methyltransferase
VLEIACGMGRWTQYAVETAEFVLATDPAINLLECARGLNLPAQGVEFQCVDAFDLDKIPGEFGCAMHLNFFNHLPDALARRFQNLLHKRLGPGNRVFVAGQQYSQKWKKQMYPKPGSPDTFSIRTENGFNFEIVDNEFDEARIRRTFTEGASDLKPDCGRGFWWATYRIK